MEWSADGLPAFFAAVPRIRVRDPLAEFLGAARGGVLEYGYADAVRLAGHSCPTVGAAFLMTRAALAALFQGELPQRGNVRVEMRDAAQDGVTGVMANVASLVTGAALETGFKGIGGRFDRRRLLAYGEPIDGEVRFTRLATATAVVTSARMDRVPADPRLPDLMRRSLADDPEAMSLLHAVWQERVRRLLIDHCDDREVIIVRPVAFA
jgi:hypothetical protein